MCVHFSALTHLLRMPLSTGDTRDPMWKVYINRLIFRYSAAGHASGIVKAIHLTLPSAGVCVPPPWYLACLWL